MQQADQSSQKYLRLDDKPYESHYLYLETLIDHAVQAVWPHALNIGSWMTDYRMETISGEAGKVGHFERVFPPGMGSETPMPHYHLYGIAETIPHKLIVLEVFPERGGSYGMTRPWMIFDSILLVDLGSKTKLILLTTAAHLGRADEPEPNQDDVARERLLRYFDNLKTLVGASAVK